MAKSVITEQLKHLPTSPGVYLMKDAEGDILYIGKAANLRNRVRSYFTASESLAPKVEQLVDRVDSLDFFITTSEQEALILEFNLIKRHRPFYNVRLKDDKSYPYLKISLYEDWPRIYLTRHVEQDGGRYFGPFASPWSVRHTLKALKRIFPFRSCEKPVTGTDLRACLEYHMHQCVGPCVGAVNQAGYLDVIKQVILFLEGRHEKVVKGLKHQMEEAARELHFERAARIRDQIEAINRVIEGQKIATRVQGDQDVVAFAANHDQAWVQVFFVRRGKLIGKEGFILQGTTSEEPGHIITSFVEQFYSSATDIPPLILLQHPVEDRGLIENWLGDRRRAKVELRVPLRGNKKELVDIVAANAEQGLRQLEIKQQVSNMSVALVEVQRALDLPRPPDHIECYDISNIQGKYAVGSMVVFERGKPKTAHYRRFRIKTVPGADDCAMLREVLGRRFRRSNRQSVGDSGAWAVVPDLILIDGGKGQLGAALTVMKELDINGIPAAGLAKEREELFVPDRSYPIILPPDSLGLRLLRHIRDEAHRFALGYHQKIRLREGLTSTLDTIPGVGPKRKRALLKKFGSFQAIREASIEELAAVDGVGLFAARKIKEHL